LIFDPRYRGESGGEQGSSETQAKLEDLAAALDFLSDLPDVDSDQRALMGICFGGSYVLRPAADDPPVGVVATTAAHLRDHAADVWWLGGDG
jgi:dienelactone hydrolase